MNLLFPTPAGCFQPVVSAEEWTPADLPGLVAAPVVSLMRSAGTLWQDSGRTTLATADGDPVYVADCTFTGTRFTAPGSSQRPVLYLESGGKWSLSFDGVDDSLVGPQLVSSAANWTLAAQFLIATASGIRSVMLNGTAGDNNGYALMVRTDAGRIGGLYPGVAWLSGSTTATIDTPHTAVLRRAGSVADIRVGGVNQTLGNNTATPNAPGSGSILGGNGAPFPASLSGRVAGWAAYTAALSDADAGLLEAYLGGLM